MTAPTEKNVEKCSSVDVPLKHELSSEIKDGTTTRTDIDKSEISSSTRDDEKQLDEERMPGIHRSTSFDPSFLQRPPSFLSIKNREQFIRRQNTVDGSGMTITSVDTIKELDSEKLVNENSSDSIVPEQNHKTEVKQTEDGESGASTTNLELSVQEVSEISGCIECVKAIPVFSSDEIDEGDHIAFAGAIYDHHAIVVAKLANEKFEIIEATNTISGVAIGMFLGRKALIGSSVKSFNFAKQNLRVIAYRIRQHSKKDTAERARNFCDGERKSEAYKYDLFDNNCEHFATYCVTGRKFSIQVTKLRLTGRLFLKSGFLGISNEMKRNEKEYDNGIICEKCFDINKRLLDVKLRPIRKAEDVQKGDIIRYSYWNLWHEAVVLSITTINKSNLTCCIAHYAFCGFLSHRTIIEEQLKIKFNGKCAMLEYGPPKYHIYDPDTVVERAKRRVGEQQFVFFSNDSSHFARWCKLKLEKE
ncbi:uncharacterized protein LOC127721043 [Mytilus californianus]|uniref:uncharacterized protein LOC127721043 n=1 Tax=Mytilus californianus TaxID=6549 RepID=UPI0022457750|nr:uncharacterized protein LOC127721043 [Mytilus californianus]